MIIVFMQVVSNLKRPYNDNLIESLSYTTDVLNFKNVIHHVNRWQRNKRLYKLPVQIKRTSFSRETINWTVNTW